MSALTLPTVSVVIPAYKARNYLRESLASVAAQNYPALEVLVIDDASPEPIDDILQEYSQNGSAPQVRRIRHERNQGLGASRNTGIREATGEYVAFLDHDDLWAPNHVTDLISTLLENDADMGFCSVLQFQNSPDDGTEVWGPREDDIDTMLAFRLFKCNFITPSAVIARRSCLNELGGFNTDPDIHMCEDLDLWLRALHSGARFAFSKHISAFYRKHPAAATSRQGYMACQSAYVLNVNQHRVEAPWLAKQSVIAAKWWAAWIALLKAEGPRWRVLARAVWQGIPVPWEIARGVVHTIRFLLNKTGRYPTHLS